MITTTSQLQKPEIGQLIYVPSSVSFDQHERDVIGGLATIKDVSNAYHTPFVDVEELPNCSFNYDQLWKQQDKLATQFKQRRAHFNLTPKAVYVAKENLDNTTRLFEYFADNVATWTDLFNDGDKESIKVVGLTLKRLQTKLNKKVK